MSSYPISSSDYRRTILRVLLITLGLNLVIDMHLVVKPPTVEAAHKITEAVEEKLETLYGPSRITIHIEPYDYESERITY